MDRRRFLASAGASAVAALAGCVGGGNDVTVTELPPNTELVKVSPGGGYEFTPDELTVSTGTTVLWKWYDGGHDVVPRDQPSDADWAGHDSLESTGFEYEYEFTVPGTYHYVCTPHENLGMTGDIIVEK